MSFSRTKLAEQIVNRLSDDDSAANLSKEVAAYLIDAGKTSELNSLSRDIMQVRKSKYNLPELTVITAHELSSHQIEDIKQTVLKISPNAKEIIINQKIDKTVIGGVRLEFANHLLDMSVSAKLNKLKRLTSKT